MKLLDTAYDLSYLQDGYTDFIKRWTEDDPEEFNDGRFHASNLGQCARKAILKRAGKKGRPWDEDKGAMLAEANFIHSGMTRFWMEQGTAIAREIRFADGPMPGWSGKFDALAHRPEWCGPKCNYDTNAMQEDFSHMRLFHDLGDERWREYAKLFHGHALFLVSLKTVAPAGLKHYAAKPAEHHVWQDSWYAYEFAGMFDLQPPTLCIMYRSRGGCATPFWHFVEPYDAPSLARAYDGEYDHYLETDQLPGVIPLVAKRHKDTSYGEIVKLEQSWECGYCDYAEWHDKDGNFRCEPNAPVNKTGDRVGVNVGGRIHLVKEWYEKTDHTQGEAVHAINSLQDREGGPIGEIAEVATAKEVKLT